MYVFHVFTFILFATAWKPRFIHKKITSRQMSPLNGAHQIKFRILFRRLIRLMWCIEFLIFTEVEKQVCNFFFYLAPTRFRTYTALKICGLPKVKKRPTGKTQLNIINMKT